MTNKERDNIALAFSQLAQQAVGLRRVMLEALNSSDMQEQGDLQDAAIHGIEYIGLIADHWASRCGGSEAKGGIDEWSMPPVFNFDLNK